MNNLYDKLKDYSQSDFYAFHMPGHKRNIKDACFSDIIGIDITEIDGFDNLHHADGILQKEQEFAAELYGAEHTFFLVNGSTCGIISSIFAVFQEKDFLLMDRNSHKSAYHAAELLGVRTEYLYPEQVNFNMPHGPVLSTEIEKKIKENPDIKGVYITSPSFDGIVCDIKAIAEIVHRYHKILIVDEAHGAHLGFHNYFPESAVKCGADIVIQSLHKLLPAMTQTALLHVNSERIDLHRLMHYLAVFQTSSPSYVLMASMSRCLHLIQENGKTLFDHYQNNLINCYEKLGQMQKLKVLDKQWAWKQYHSLFDPSKLILYVDKPVILKGQVFHGNQLKTVLREQYHLELEMATEKYALAMTSIMDTKEGFQRLCDACLRIDRELILNTDGEDRNKTVVLPDMQLLPEMTIKEAFTQDGETILLKQASGRISKEYIYLYPPGSPIIVPGEVLSERIIQKLLELQKLGLSVQGMEDYSLKYINVIKRA